MPVRSGWAAFPIAAALLLGAQAIAGVALAQAPSSPEILALSASFDPREVTVATGTPVVWSNRSVFPHTVDFDDRSFSDYLFRDGDTLTWTPTEPGSYLYSCRYHGSGGGLGMSGLIVVTGDPIRPAPPAEMQPEEETLPEPVDEPAPDLEVA